MTVKKNLRILANKKLIIFDFDGVIIDSKKNMSLAWNSVCRELSSKVLFATYFKNIGLPFNEILKKIKFEKNFRSANFLYNKAAVDNQHRIKLFAGAKKIVNQLHKKKIICLVTSKSRQRTKTLIKKFKLKFDYVFCPEDFSPFKPNPKIITNLKNKLNLNLSEIVYIGDMPIDRKFAKLAGVDFIHASYGYGKKVKYGNSVRDLKDLYNKLFKN
jgi:phosphoglycolate phosphatase